MVNYLKAICLFLAIYSCSNEVEKKYTKLYLTTSTSAIYCFDLQKQQLLWQVPQEDIKNDELTYFSLTSNTLIKAYLYQTIATFDKFTGKKINQIKDSLTPEHDYYNYDFKNIRAVLFSQYPLVYKDNFIFGNSKGEIKSISSSKTNWVYQNSNPVFCSPIILNKTVFINLGYGIISLNADTGKKIASAAFEEANPREVIIDQQKIYMVSEYGTVVCLNENLEVLWKYKHPAKDYYVHTNVFINEENLYFGKNTLVALNKTNGDLQWETPIAKDQENELVSIAKDAAGVVVSTTNSILKIDNEGTITNEKKINKTKLVGTLLAANNSFFYTTTDGGFYSIDNNLKNEKKIYGAIHFNKEDSYKDTYMIAE